MIFFLVRPWLLHQVCLLREGFAFNSYAMPLPIPSQWDGVESQYWVNALKSLQSGIRIGLWELGLLERGTEPEVGPRCL